MNKIDLQGRVAVITGGARGIGYAIAERMLMSGAMVSLWDIDGTQLQKAEQQLSVSGKVSVSTLELTDEKSVQEAAADVWLINLVKLIFLSIMPVLPGTMALHGNLRLMYGARL